MSKYGVTDLMLTPHYVKNSDYVCNNKDKRKLYKELCKRVKEEGIDINLYLGNEVYFCKDLLDLIKNKEIMPLNNSKYVLFEFPLNNVYKDAIVVISELISKGYVPIMAHPERYKLFQRHPELAADYVRMGVLLQGNIPSLFGKYGKAAKKVMDYYIKNGWIAFLGSDTHHVYKGVTEKRLRRILHKINKDDNYIERIISTNFDKVINNENMEIKRFY